MNAKLKMIIFLGVLVTAAALVINIAPKISEAPAENYVVKKVTEFARLLTGERNIGPEASPEQAAVEAKLEIAKQAEAARKKYSRVSFFLREPLIGSLAVPAEWEGKFRMAEAGNTADFLFSEPRGRELPLFSLKLTEREYRDEKQNDWRVLKTEGDFIFSARVYAPEDLRESEVASYEKMKGEIEEILKSFKVYNNS